MSSSPSPRAPSRCAPLRFGSAVSDRARMPADAPPEQSRSRSSYGGQSSVPFPLTHSRKRASGSIRNAKAGDRRGGLGLAEPVSLQGTGLGSSREVEVLAGDSGAPHSLQWTSPAAAPAKTRFVFAIPRIRHAPATFRCRFESESASAMSPRSRSAGRSGCDVRGANAGRNRADAGGRRHADRRRRH